MNFTNSTCFSYRDSIIIVLLDISTSFLAGITVFAGTGVVVNHMGNNVTVDFLQTYGTFFGAVNFFNTIFLN